MRSRLSYYSVLLLVGLAVVSVILFTMNPFNAPASASPATWHSASTTSVASGNAPSGSSSLAGGGFDVDHHHHSDGLPGENGVAGNRTATTTTTAGIHSQNE